MMSLMFLGGYAVWMWVMLPTFRRYTLPPSSEMNLSFVISVTLPAHTRGVLAKKLN
jgi:hypothetical protein